MVHRTVILAPKKIECAPLFQEGGAWTMVPIGECFINFLQQQSSVTMINTLKDASIVILRPPTIGAAVYAWMRKPRRSVTGSESAMTPLRASKVLGRLLVHVASQGGRTFFFSAGCIKRQSSAQHHYSSSS